MIEHRTTHRASTHLTARAALDRTSSETLPCWVRNLSPIGACVVFCAEVTVPECFDLFLGSSGRPYRVRQVWHDANTVGVSFVEARENAPEVFPDPAGSGEDRPSA